MNRGESLAITASLVTSTKTNGTRHRGTMDLRKRKITATIFSMTSTVTGTALYDTATGTEMHLNTT